MPLRLTWLGSIVSIKVILVLGRTELTHRPRVVDQLRGALLQHLLKVLVAPVLTFLVRFLSQQSQVEFVPRDYELVAARVRVLALRLVSTARFLDLHALL